MKRTGMRNLGVLAVMLLAAVLATGCSQKKDNSPEDTATQDTAQTDVPADLATPDVPGTDVPPAEDLVQDTPCVPNCEGKACGDDGCGNECGYCQVGFSCLDGVCEEDECVPNCAIKACGSDGCGGECGVCEGDSYCGPAFQCIPFDCTPDCFNKDCGDDECDGSCGECKENETCVDFLCVPNCVPSCTDKQCGDDGCGGDCGQCETNYSCSTNSCVPSSQCVATAQCIFACIDAGGVQQDCATTCYQGVEATYTDIIEEYSTCAVTECTVPFAMNYTDMHCIMTNCYADLSNCLAITWGTGNCQAAAICMSNCTSKHPEECMYSCADTAMKTSMEEFLAVAACIHTNCPTETDPANCPACATLFSQCLGM